MTPTERAWETSKAEYIGKLMASFQKYFGKNAISCPDCGGPAWHICEKNLRDIVGLTLEATRRDTKEQVDAAEARGREIACDYVQENIWGAYATLDSSDRVNAIDQVIEAARTTKSDLMKQVDKQIGNAVKRLGEI